MRKDRIGIGALCLVLAGCGGHGSTAVPTTSSVLSQHRVVTPQVVQTGKAPVHWTQFGWGDTSAPSAANSIVTGSDKNVWYADYSGHALIKMTMTGTTTKYSLSYGAGSFFYPTTMTVGADGKFYMATPAVAGLIGVATTTGAFTTKIIPSGDYGYESGLTLGPDGNVWFAERAHVAKITPGGTVTEYAYPDGYTTNNYGAIATGADGDVWVTEYNYSVIDDVNPATGAMTAYPLPCAPNGLVAAKDGNYWVSCSNYLLRVTPGGSVTTYINPFSNDTYPTAFALGPDGNPWFTVSSANQIGEFNTVTNALTIYYPPSTHTTDYGLTTGPDGNIWALDSNLNTDVYIIKVLGVSPATVAFHVGNVQTLTITESGTTAWTATSSNPGVASVAQGSPANKFTLTANGLGTTNVTIKDAIGNSFVVKVKVT